MSLAEYILPALSLLFVIVDPLAAVAVQFMLNGIKAFHAQLILPTQP